MRNQQDLKKRREFAAEMLREFHESGLRRRAFAEKHGVALSTLDYWLTRERKKVAKLESAPLVFSELKVSSPGSQEQWAMEILSSKGITVRSRQALPAELLIQLFRTR